MHKLAAMDAFIRVVDTGSFSGAARQLQIGQPAVSKAVAQLEEDLGVRLLLRSTHGLAATEAGQHFYEHAKRAVDAAEEAEQAARGAGATLKGRLRIVAAVTFARLHIIPKLGEFLSAHPALEIDVVLDDRSIDLIETGSDVALRMGGLEDSSLIARKIAQARRLTVATPAYLTRWGEPRTPADLADHNVIVYNVRGGGTAWTFTKDGTATSVTTKGRLRVTAAEGVRAAVINDLGLAIASEWMFSDELERGTVKEVLSDWELPPMDLWAVFPTGRQPSAKARSFVEFVERTLAGARSSSAGG